ncbi:ABC transporter ATP-binding protein [Winogradskyella sp. SYSU M77433]|uniref:ABC transporter ATP-binding protein n=1 Tax=Winogradskyella sp. SYSU M77433 TaxID=3042722 RepID=UPI0024803F16|nr:ABC transporter ATP-binding protein [Winogradskyella sp. SYSU M77433]MDH7913007.1 ABC transporter ATP-binding protein [Winogradskyella sp. SYSU M77433]
MSEVILKVEHISKQYRLGLVGTGTLSHDLKRWFYKLRGKEDPYLKIGDTNDRSKAAESDYVWAIKDINFEVKRGEVLGIIGKNGAGKSTLLKILSRVTSPTTGQIKTKGRIASLLEVGTGFHPELTGKENIYLNGAILGMTKTEIKAKEQEIIEFSGCQRYIDTPVKRYSSGMRVRLAFAVAAFLEPDILVVDEVLAVGDAEFQKKAIGKMQDISKGDGRTVLFVSHNMAAVENLCTRAILLENGKVKFEGGTKDCIQIYLKGKKITSSDFDSKFIKKVRMLNKNNEVSNQFVMGEDFTLEITSSGIKNTTGLHLGFFIKDTYEQKLTAFSTAMKSVVVEQNKGLDEEVFLFKIRKPNLIEGDYIIDISVSFKKGGRLDFIDSAISFNVIASDIYGNGVLLNSHFGKIYLDVETTLKINS